MICSYDGSNYVGLVCNIDNTQKDVEIKFMHPSLPTGSLSWPQRDDLCWVIPKNILMVIKAPVLASLSGRTYQLESDDLNKFNKLIANSK